MANWFNLLGLHWDEERGVGIWCLNTPAAYYAHYYLPKQVGVPLAISSEATSVTRALAKITA